jgi:hypothetical protein
VRERLHSTEDRGWHVGRAARGRDVSRVRLYAHRRGLTPGTVDDRAQGLAASFRLRPGSSPARQTDRGEVIRGGPVSWVARQSPTDHLLQGRRYAEQVRFGRLDA